MTKTSTLRTRRFIRASIDLPVEVEITPAHGEQVRYSAASDAVSVNRLRARAVDLSTGGMGLELNQFIPRGCEAIVRIFPADASGEAQGDCILSHAIKIRRIYLRATDPSEDSLQQQAHTYLAGVEFTGAGAETTAQIQALRERLGLPPEEVKDDA